MRTANREKHYHINSAVSHQVYVHALLLHSVFLHILFFFSSASTEYIFSIYDVVYYKIRKSLDLEKAEKFVKIYRLCRAEEDNH